MALMRWCICPVVMEWQHPPADWLDGSGGLKPGKPGGWWLRRPKVSLITDPGRPANPYIKFNPVTGNKEPVLDVNGDQVMIPKTVTHSSVISNGPATPLLTIAPPPLIETDDDKWCLSLCCAVDFSELEKDADIEDVLGEVYQHTEHPLFLDNTPRMRQWSGARIDEVKRIMVDRARVPGNVIESKINEHTPFKAMLFEIGRGINLTFDPAKTHTSIKE